MAEETEREREEMSRGERDGGRVREGWRRRERGGERGKN